MSLACLHQIYRHVILSQGELQRCNSCCCTIGNPAHVQNPQGRQRLHYQGMGEATDEQIEVDIGAGLNQFPNRLSSFFTALGPCCSQHTWRCPRRRREFFLRRLWKMSTLPSKNCSCGPKNGAKLGSGKNNHAVRHSA